MNPVIDRLSSLFEPSWQSLVNIVDILLVTFLVYRLLLLVRGRRAWNIIIGIGFFAAALFLSEWLGLRTLNWILDKATLLAPVALVLLFLPELRQAIEGFAKFGTWSGKLISGESGLHNVTLDEIVKASEELARTSTGALIVIERQSNLEEIASNGVKVKAIVTAELLGAIFYEGNPLHDGAVVICDDLVLSAACRLPLSESTRLGNKYHMRHRAGIGVSEVTDCVVVIVSEERGAISLAIDGRLEVMPDGETLAKRLHEEFADLDARTRRSGLSLANLRRRAKVEEDSDESSPKVGA